MQFLKEDQIGVKSSSWILNLESLKRIHWLMLNSLEFLGIKMKDFIILVMTNPKEASCLPKQINTNYIITN